MNAKKIFRTVETHTLGQPTRNIIGGFPHVPGSTMACLLYTSDAADE